MLFGLSYALAGVLTWIIVGSYALYKYKVQRHYWSEGKEVGVCFATFFAGPLWPITIIYTIIWFISESLYNTSQEKKKK